ncbi:hypothetical protein CCY01nite_33760 [Chitinophaga cymbidii]|uniref:PA14 domain-containing protein n=2 Tax=Chitinophaga cymbidii TaxID=1096750 RepID=A0A512RN38_9BACT|nr:hypothetical protein CCY01nite_33760 [Chitinophaga cymbidii]
MLICLPVLSAQAQQSVYGPVAEAIQANTHNLFISSNGNYYKQNNSGSSTFHYWWNSNGLDALTDGYLRTHSQTYLQRMKTLLNGIRTSNGNTYINHFYDDMEWLAISSLRAYENTGDADYLNVANTLWTDIQTGMHPERSYAVQWNKSQPNSFNACSNGPAIIFAARLHQVTGNAVALQRAQSIYAWQKSVLVDPVNGAVWDGYDAATGNTNTSWIFSYNIGTWIGAALELYQVTGTQSYLDDAVKTAEYAMNNHLSGGVFFTNETGAGDGGLFKGIFIRYFTLLAREGALPAATKARYENAIRSSAQALNGRGINAGNLLMNPNWTTKPGATTDYSTQLSGIMLLEAAATLDQVFFYKHLNFGGYSGGFSAGSHTHNGLIAGGVANDDITSFTVPAGFEVQMFEHDNFAGASTTRTATQGWIGGDWNDRVSSVIINHTAGDGLSAEYFNGINFNTFRFSRDDEAINFVWGNGSPDYRVNTDSFSVRWTGKIQPRYTEVYTFYVNSDNGRRLWINNQLIIDKWIDDWGVEYSGTISLTAGQQYDIRLEYFEHNGGADCKLEWASASQAREVVPKSQLYTPLSAGSMAYRPQIMEATPALLIAGPNPFRDVVKITVENTMEETLQVRLYNMSGMEVTAPQQILNGQTVNLSAVPAGVYILRVMAGKKIYTRRMLKY